MLRVATSLRSASLAARKVVILADSLGVIRAGCNHDRRQSTHLAYVKSATELNIPVATDCAPGMTPQPRATPPHLKPQQAR
eukprot:763224-Amphidinium_carterae.1